MLNFQIFKRKFHILNDFLVSFQMVEDQKIWCRIPYLGNAIFQPSKMKQVLTYLNIEFK